MMSLTSLAVLILEADDSDMGLVFHFIFIASDNKCNIVMQG